MQPTNSTIQQQLDLLVARTETADFILDDPIRFAHRYSHRQDVEIAALLASTIAWGNRHTILASCEKLFGCLMENHPYRYVMEEVWRDNAQPSGINSCSSLEATNIHRTFFGHNLIYFCRGLRAYYLQHDSLEWIFSKSDCVWDGIADFRNMMAAANRGECSKHISNPTRGNSSRNGAACKRLNMMLRWLCRTGSPVDLGLWSSIPPARLMIPLDVHVARNARMMGLLTRTQDDRLAVEELTANLRKLSPDDPVKYDFALFMADMLL